MLDMYCVAVTGRIASGKSEVSRLLASCGAFVVDCDAISHQLTEAGGGAIVPLRTHFGEAYFDTKTGALNRSKMASLVFSDQSARLFLERILHPLIEREARLKIKEAVNGLASYVVLDIPLLFRDSSWVTDVNSILLVRADSVLRRARLRERGLDECAIDRILDVQNSLMLYAYYDDVIHNNGTLEALSERVQVYHQKFCSLAKIGMS